ncbi:ComEC/Rec2 family competence protein [Leptolyngbya sp. FACHB-321]|uniref:ComEC/Rec2 family competence protein n=1 Tax=Leptolyngbya sp. FACHB-321 TaxID=2692807 RepID=UPI0016873212|nr:ComEC/Rec2 family competence protein [Leptolyngbya sp. FACHB-321]MBD2036071.1 ComEC/Rec2 family competence protein [Leptolyngbya sp. FACHB-321]
MTATGAVVLSLAYILGLLVAKLPWGGYGLLVLGVGLSFGIKRVWRSAPKSWVWLLAGLLGLFASLYCQFRTPQPAITDISRLIPTANAPKQEWVVIGDLDSVPRLTRSQKAQFWLEVRQVNSVSGEVQYVEEKAPTGKLYVTVPLLQATGLHPGQRVQMTGALYLPQPATNPGGFDFQAYLRQEGCFAGMRSKQAEVLEERSRWGWWQIRQRVVRSQMLWLGSPAGALVSAMVLGSRGVDLPFDLKDQFTQAGLAHALAASGFQSSLILGVVLALTRRFSAKVQFVAGTTALLVFVGLTGIQPAVLRAAVMGFGGLVALVMERKVKPLGALLVAGVLLLLFNPLWLWNLGFQLSFLATMGLMVTVPPLTKRLDWMPSAIAPLFAVPIAAYLWTLPLQLAAFGVLSPYSILVNLITTPLISILSIGGMISALAALIWSPAGSALAWLLKYPAQALMLVVDGFSQLPGNAYAVGTISALAAIVLYCLLSLTWLQPWWRKRWWVALLLAIGLVVFPAWQASAAMFRLTLLATTGQPVMVLQESGRAALINSGDASTAGFAVLPFLQKAGVNELTWAIATDRPSKRPGGWGKVAERLPIKQLYTVKENLIQDTTLTVKPTLLAAGQTAQIGSSQFKLLSTEPLIASLQLRQQTWTLLGSLSLEQQQTLLQSGRLPKTQVLWWFGQQLQPDVVAALRPQVAIATTQLYPQTEAQLRQLGTQVYALGRDGALQWTPINGFKTTLESQENSPSAL